MSLKLHADVKVRLIEVSLPRGADTFSITGRLIKSGVFYIH